MANARIDPRASFLAAGTWHGSLEQAEAILAAHPEVASSDIFPAAVLGDDAAVRRGRAGLPAGRPTGRQGRTPLALAVKACVDSYWAERRSPESVWALLDAGASLAAVPYPCGYAEVDELLERARSRP